MAQFEEILVCRFAEADESEETLGVTYSAQRVPYKVMSAHNIQTAEYPYITNITNGGGWITRGVHQYSQAAGGNNNGTVLRYLYGGHRDDLMSLVQIRFVNTQEVKVAAAVRIDSAGTKCYALELVWNGGTTSWDAQVYRYDTATGTVGGGTKVAIGAVISGFISGNGALAWKIWAIGLSAQTSGGQVNIFVYKQQLLQPGGSSSSQNGSLSNISKSIISTATRVDSTAGRLLGPTQIFTGIKWQYHATPVTANTEERLVMEWGCFQVFGSSSTQPSTPTLVLTSSGGNEIQASSSVFEDSDPSDSHVKSRWLLFEAVGNAFLPWPIVDTDFTSSHLLSYTFVDLSPGKTYAVRVQYLDNEGNGDVSSLSAFTYIKVSGQPNAILSAVEFVNRSSASGFPRNNTFVLIDPALITGEQVWAFINDGNGATSVGSVVARFDRGSAWSQTYRRVAFREPGLVAGTSTPVYNSVIGTMVFLRWKEADTKLSIGARCTLADQDGFYVSKTVSGATITYTVIKRVLIGTDPNSSTPGDWANTTVIGPVTIPLNKIGVNGERVILTSYDAGSVKNLSLAVNGILLGAASGSAADLGFDANHQWSAVMMEDGPLDFLIQQIGQISLAAPGFPIVIVPQDEATGAGMHHPGPFMDPFDTGTDVGGVPNVWWQSGGKFRFRTGAASGDINGLGWLAFNTLQLTTHNYSVKSTFFNGCGPAVRFTTPWDCIFLTVTNVAGDDFTYTLYFLEANAVTASYTCTITDALYLTFGAEIILQVTTDLGSFVPGDVVKTIQVKAYYNGTAMSFDGVGETVNQVVSSGSPLLTGRFAIFRSPLSAAGNDIEVCSTIEAYDATSLSPPDQPSLSQSNEQTAKISFTLTSSAFSDPDPSSTHGATEWEVYRHPLGTLLWRSNTDAVNLTAITVTPGVGTWHLTGLETEGFDTNTSYKARVRHRDSSGIWSPWSAYIIFTTSVTAPNNVAIANLPTFPTEPLVSQAYEESIQYNTTISLSDSGKEQRKSKWTVPRRIFRLRYDNRIESEIDTIWDFYRTVGFGRLNLFVFIHPISGVSYICRFLEDGMTRSTVEFQIQSTGLALIEVPV